MSKELLGRGAFYGTLRHGDYNWEYYKDGLNLHRGGVKLYGYKMYDTGYGYPCVVRTDELSDSIVVDLFDVDQKAARRIYGMEIGAGYTHEVIAVGGKTYSMYVYESADGMPLIESGDWFQYAGKGGKVSE